MNIYIYIYAHALPATLCYLWGGHLSSPPRWYFCDDGPPVENVWRRRKSRTVVWGLHYSFPDLLRHSCGRPYLCVCFFAARWLKPWSLNHQAGKEH